MHRNGFFGTVQLEQPPVPLVAQAPAVPPEIICKEGGVFAKISIWEPNWRRIWATRTTTWEMYSPRFFLLHLFGGGTVTQMVFNIYKHEEAQKNIKKNIKKNKGWEH